MSVKKLRYAIIYYFSDKAAILHKYLKISGDFLFMLGEFSFEDATEVCEQTRNIVNAAGKNYGWTPEECGQNTVLNSYDSGKTFKKVSYILENILKRNKTRLGNEKIKMIFDYSKDKEYSDISVMFRPIIGNAYVAFNSFGFCEDSLSAYFSKHSVMLKELFRKDYIKNTLFGENDAVSVFLYYNLVFDRVSEALQTAEFKDVEDENTLTVFGVPRNFPTFKEFESNHKKTKNQRGVNKSDFYVLLQDAG